MVDEETTGIAHESLPHPSPLRTDEGGCLRVGSTRVSLDTVVGEYNAGATPEEIVLEFPSLELHEVYATVSFYLHHQTLFDAYLAGRQHEALAIRSKLESRGGGASLRDKLRQRQRRSD
jgi:uncharacterized protein (DUF433 family)